MVIKEEMIDLTEDKLVTLPQNVNIVYYEYSLNIQVSTIGQPVKEQVHFTFYDIDNNIVYNDIKEYISSNKDIFVFTNSDIIKSIKSFKISSKRISGQAWMARIISSCVKYEHTVLNKDIQQQMVESIQNNKLFKKHVVIGGE